MTSKWRTAGRMAAPLAILVALAACEGSGLPTKDDFERLGDERIQDRNPDARRTADDAVNFFSEAPVTRLQTSQSNAFSLSTDPGQKVPRVPIGQINAAPMQFGALLNQIAEQAGMSWRISGPQKSELMNQDIYLVQRSETMLETVLKELSELTDAFYRVEGDRIIFSQDRLFVARVPRMAGSQDVFVEGLGSLGATDIFQDNLTGTVSFRATRPIYDSVKRLMRSLELGRDMIVYDFWLIDRDISDSSGLGGSIDLTWESGTDEAGIEIGGSSVVENLFGSATDRGFVSGNLGDIGVEATARFLRSLGETETIARPTISMLSGGESSFSSGEKSEYIRSVNSDSNDGTTSSGTDVRSLETGVDITVEGSHNGGVISTAFEIDVSELLAFEEFDTGEVTLRLPRTAQRVLDAHLEARPGDVMVIGGIIRDTEDKDRTEITGIGVPTQTGKSANKTETIILVRPRLVQIRPSVGAGRTGMLEVEPGIGEMAPDENPITDVIEDEARARKLLDRLK